MNIELNKEELDLLIDSLNINMIIQIYKISYEISLSDYDVSDLLDLLKERLSSIYNLKSKLCNYSNEFKEEN